MSDPTVGIGDGAVSETDEDLEWLPREILESPRTPLFRRLTPDERLRRRQPRDPRARVPAIGSALSRRIVEVESTVARAAAAIDRSNDLLRALIEQGLHKT